ncbi:unnamed protein product [Cylindrotheca closterium]|uniref:Uncharacterized protein n=1 Tax=Cylindrotheca closterium TaxID=2856 RepID=A0AAD2FM32_9STRA|nr:unnamed protein product [Cylindrotheca closterium]
MSTDVAGQTVVSKVEDETVQTEEQTMPEEEPYLADAGDVADNDDSTVDSKEQERRERRRAKIRERKLRELEEEIGKDDDTYFSASNGTNKKEDGYVTKAIDRFVDLLNPVEKEFDEEDGTMVSEATENTIPTISKETKPSMMQQLDKHVLTRFGCSSNPAYIPEDEAVETPLESAEAESVEEEKVPDGDQSAFGPNSILRVEDHGEDPGDPGDPDIQLTSLDEETSSDGSADQPQGARSFFCGAVPMQGAVALKGEKGDSNVMSEIAEEKDIDPEQSKGIIYSPSQLDEIPFDQQPKAADSGADATTDQSALGGAKKAFGTLTENMGPMFASISQTVRTKVFLEGDVVQTTEKASAPKAAESTLVEGETIFEEAAMEGHEVPANDNEPSEQGEEVPAEGPKTNDDEPSEQGEEVPAGPESFERMESEMPFDEAAKSETGHDSDAEAEKEENPEVEEEKTPKAEEAPKKEEPEEAPKEEVKAPAPVTEAPIKPATKSSSTKSKAAATTKQPKDKKKKKSLLGRIFKKKSKKNEAPKESILMDDEKKNVSPSEKLIIPKEPAKKVARPVVPEDPTITNQAKRESWKNAKRQASAKKELDAAIPMSDFSDFDLIATSSKRNDDWDKLANPITPHRPTTKSASSPSGVADFSDQMAEL